MAFISSHSDITRFEVHRYGGDDPRTRDVSAVVVQSWDDRDGVLRGGPSLHLSWDEARDLAAQLCAVVYETEEATA